MAKITMYVMTKKEVEIPDEDYKALVGNDREAWQLALENVGGYIDRFGLHLGRFEPVCRNGEYDDYLVGTGVMAIVDGDGNLLMES